MGGSGVATMQSISILFEATAFRPPTSTQQRVSVATCKNFLATSLWRLPNKAARNLSFQQPLRYLRGETGSSSCSCCTDLLWTGGPVKVYSSSHPPVRRYPLPLLPSSSSTVSFLHSIPSITSIYTSFNHVRHRVEAGTRD